MFETYNNDNRADLSTYDPDSGIDVEEDYGFSIDSPELADWAVEKIKETEQGYDIGIQAAKAKIETLKAWISETEIKKTEKNQFLKTKLYDYINGVETRKTKTQKVLELPSGKIILKFASPQMKPDKDALIKKLGDTEYVSLTPAFAWGEYKKNLEIKGDVVIDKTTGEVVDGVTVEMSQEIIEIK